MTEKELMIFKIYLTEWTLARVYAMDEEIWEHLTEK